MNRILLAVSLVFAANSAFAANTGFSDARYKELVGNAKAVIDSDMAKINVVCATDKPVNSLQAFVLTKCDKSKADLISKDLDIQPRSLESSLQSYRAASRAISILNGAIVKDKSNFVKSNINVADVLVGKVMDSRESIMYKKNGSELSPKTRKAISELNKYSKAMAGYRHDSTIDEGWAQ